MYTSIRNYTADPNDAAAIIDIVRQSNITEVISGLPGFVAYYFVDCAKGSITTISIFDDQAGAEHSNAVAAEWVRENILPTHSLSVPDITAGGVILSS